MLTKTQKDILRVIIEKREKVDAELKAKIKDSAMIVLHFKQEWMNFQNFEGNGKNVLDGILHVKFGEDSEARDNAPISTALFKILTVNAQLEICKRMAKRNMDAAMHREARRETELISDLVNTSAAAAIASPVQVGLAFGDIVTSKIKQVVNDALQEALSKYNLGTTGPMWRTRAGRK
jgi:hypothetical protein